MPRPGPWGLVIKEANVKRTDRICLALRRAAGVLLVTGLALSGTLLATAEDDMPMNPPAGSGTGTGQPGPGMPGMGGGGQAPAATIDNAEMQRRVGELRHHLQMMDGIQSQDTKKLLGEMLKHMRMMDEMMAQIVTAQGSSAGAPGTTVAPPMGGHM